MAHGLTLGQLDVEYLLRALGREMRWVNKRMAEQSALRVDAKYLLLLTERLIAYQKELAATESKFKLKVRRT